MTIHSFSDASNRAYGAVIYARTEHSNDEISVRLIAAKSKVAPLSLPVTVPRLELMAALMSLELSQTVANALEMDINQTTFWTDSMDVVYWLNNQVRVFKPFVANRLAEIHRSTIPSQWRHVPGKNNLADLISRGVKASQLINNNFWWEGPEFLKSHKSSWPQTFLQKKLLDRQEVRKSELERLEVNNTFICSKENENNL